MAIYHRRLLSEQDSDQTLVCSDNCDYVSTYWPPEPPPPPPASAANTDNITVHISPYIILSVSLLVSALLFATYYFIIVRYCTRFRRVSATHVNQQSQSHDGDFIDGQNQFDHPIWYIATVGLQPAVINSITVVRFKTGESLTGGSADCTVCLGEFKDDEFLRILPKCNHAFHVTCIDTWLRSHTNCPVCRASVVSGNSNGAVSELSDQDRNQRFDDLNQNHGSDNTVQENGIEEFQDSKPEVVTRELGFVDSNSTTDMHGLNHMRD
ncbi:hypothetical protein SSX86_013582 [Deinandra increscens subsp. villosa]|uniref:RING-type E3 ubiquitin transferase n=1 Tax=Deinandra increscens subsp. villosa TaxID=3103831 RepID=A0AAP0D1V8_9ASTR